MRMEQRLPKDDDFMEEDEEEACKKGGDSDEKEPLVSKNKDEIFAISLHVSVVIVFYFNNVISKSPYKIYWVLHKK